mmetsp:Transcript_3393/g.8389  ORF Transcript_3393/g.8389 Transcript_3393/m.8389 type:complete len:334 (+) Transcript_3393:1108-2109(+)
MAAVASLAGGRLHAGFGALRVCVVALRSFPSLSRRWGRLWCRACLWLGSVQPVGLEIGVWLGRVWPVLLPFDVEQYVRLLAEYHALADLADTVVIHGMPHPVGSADKAVVVARMHRVAGVHEHRVQVVHDRAAAGRPQEGREVELRLKVDLLADLVPVAAKLKALELQREHTGRAVESDALHGSDVGAGLGAAVAVLPLQHLARGEVLQRLDHRAGAVYAEAEVQEWLVRVGLVFAVEALDLAAQAATKYLVDERRLGNLRRRPRGQALETALMERVEQAAQILVRVLLPAKPEALRHLAQALGVLDWWHRTAARAEGLHDLVLRNLQDVHPA